MGKDKSIPPSWINTWKNVLGLRFIHVLCVRFFFFLSRCFFRWIQLSCHLTMNIQINDASRCSSNWYCDYSKWLTILPKCECQKKIYTAHIANHFDDQSHIIGMWSFLICKTTVFYNVGRKKSESFEIIWLAHPVVRILRSIISIGNILTIFERCKCI